MIAFLVQRGYLESLDLVPYTHTKARNTYNAYLKTILKSVKYLLKLKTVRLNPQKGSIEYIEEEAFVPEENQILVLCRVLLINDLCPGLINC